MMSANDPFAGAFAAGCNSLVAEAVLGFAAIFGPDTFEGAGGCPIRTVLMSLGATFGVTVLSAGLTASSSAFRLTPFCEVEAPLMPGFVVGWVILAGSVLVGRFGGGGGALSPPIEERTSLKKLILGNVATVSQGNYCYRAWFVKVVRCILQET